MKLGVRSTTRDRSNLINQEMFEDTLILPTGLVCFLRHQFDAVIHIHLVEPNWIGRVGNPISLYLRLKLRKQSSARWMTNWSAQRLLFLIASILGLDAESSAPLFWVKHISASHNEVDAGSPLPRKSHYRKYFRGHHKFGFGHHPLMNTHQYISIYHSIFNT